jgi:hypothetical protein
MLKFAAIALTSVLGIAGVVTASPAAADARVTLGIPVAYGPGTYAYQAYQRGPSAWRRNFYRHDFYRDHFRAHGYYRR